MVIYMPSEQLTLPKRIIKCECIDKESLADIKLALITVRNTYQDVSTKFPELRTEARKIDELIYEFNRIKPCPG